MEKHNLFQMPEMVDRIEVRHIFFFPSWFGRLILGPRTQRHNSDDFSHQFGVVHRWKPPKRIPLQGLFNVTSTCAFQSEISQFLSLPTQATPLSQSINLKRKRSDTRYQIDDLDWCFFWQILVDLGASAIPNGDSSPVLVFKEPIAHIAELHAWLRTQRLTKVCAWFLEHGLRLACTFCILLCRLHGRWDKLVIPFELHACTRIAFSWLQISITGLLWYILGLQ
jgi:hypothetical protein